jgi:Ca2+-binding EF-hand superfamily protein
MAKSTKILKEGEEEQPRKFSNEVKKHFLEIVSTYNKYQEAMDRKSDLTQIAETLGGIVEAAQQLAVNEADDWFDKHTVKRNMSELSKLGKEFDKFAVEAKSLDQRLGGLYEDMGHILSRYYKLGDISENEMKTRLGVNETINNRFGDWSVTREDVNSIKLVNQETMDDILVHKTDNSRLQKYETSYKKRRIIQPSLKQLMASVIKLDESINEHHEEYPDKLLKMTIGDFLTKTKENHVELYHGFENIIDNYINGGNVAESKLTESSIERYVASAVASRNGEHPVGFSIFVKSKGYSTKELPKLYKTKSEAETALKKMGVNESKLNEDTYKKGDVVVLQDGSTQKKAVVVQDGIDSQGRVRVRPAGFPMDMSISTIKNPKVYILRKESVNVSKQAKLMESAMSELDIMAQEASGVSSFVKDVFKEFPQLPKRRDTIDYLTKIYKDTKKRTENESITEALNEYDEWRNTKIQAKNIFRMLKQKYNNVTDMKKGLADILKQNKTKPDQENVMWQEFNDFFKIKESVNERKEFPSKEELVAYMVKHGHNKNGAQRVIDQNYDYVKKHYQGSGLPTITDVLWTVNEGKKRFNETNESIKENFTPQDIEMIKKVVDKEKKLIGLGKIFDRMGWHTDFVMIDSVPPHLKIRKKKNDKQYYLLVNKRYVDKPDWVSGEIAGGLDESVEKKNLIVNEAYGDDELKPGKVLHQRDEKGNILITITLVSDTARGWKVKEKSFYNWQGDKIRNPKEKIKFYDNIYLKGPKRDFKENTNESVNEEDFIPGGLAKDKSIEDIANKHNVDVNELVAQFKKGIAVEMEHTTDVNIAKEISLDHLFEDPKYYDKLSTIENVTEALHGYATVTGGYMDKHKDEYKLAKQLLKKASGEEIEFYDELEDLHTKLGHPKYMIWLSNALRGYKVDMYKDPKIKNKAEAEEALYILSK